MVLSRSRILRDTVSDTKFCSSSSPVRGSTSWRHYLRPVREVLQYRSLQSSIFSRSECMANSFPLFCPRQRCLLDLSWRTFCDMHFVLERPIILRRTSILNGRTRGLLSNGTNLQALYASSYSGAIASVAIRRATFAIVLDKLQDASLESVIVLRHLFASTPDGPWLPCAGVLMWLTLVCS